MLDRLLKLQQFCQNHSTEYPKLDLTEDEWLDILHLAEALRTPAKITTKVLQLEQLTLGDFYGEWLKFKFKTKKIGSAFATALYNAMVEREKKFQLD